MLLATHAKLIPVWHPWNCYSLTWNTPPLPPPSPGWFSTLMAQSICPWWTHPPYHPLQNKVTRGPKFLSILLLLYSLHSTYYLKLPYLVRTHSGLSIFPSYNIMSRLWDSNWQSCASPCPWNRDRTEFSFCISCTYF